MVFIIVDVNFHSTFSLYDLNLSSLRISEILFRPAELPNHLSWVHMVHLQLLRGFFLLKFAMIYL
jgi:hypothetical protein